MKINKHREKSRLIIYDGKKLMVLKKKQSDLKYGLVGGFLKKNESPEQALIRETQEETGVILSINEIEYHISVTVKIESNSSITKHYFTCRNHNKPFSLQEPHKFEAIEWIVWEEALKYCGKSDRKIIKSLFEPCKL